MNIVFVSYGHLNSNSGIHIFNIASRLQEKGFTCSVFVPNDKEYVSELGTSTFEVLNFQDLGKVKLQPDFIHAWTPREVVRRFVDELLEIYDCPYLVHLEDNEEHILLKETGLSRFQLDQKLASGKLKIPENLSHPLKYKRFIQASSGVTALVDNLLEFKPSSLPGLVFWPGYDLSFEAVTGSKDWLRKKLKLKSDEKVVVYTGNVHASNREEVFSLYLAVEFINKIGIKLKLIRTGVNCVAVVPRKYKSVKKYCKELGFVSRSEMSSILSLADILVQPGKADVFNDYRFPSKLPEYLISGKAVVLPDSNIGQHLSDGVNAVIIKRGDAIELANKMVELLIDDDLNKKIGNGGRLFAKNNLNWELGVSKLIGFYNSFGS